MFLRQQYLYSLQYCYSLQNDKLFHNLKVLGLSLIHISNYNYAYWIRSPYNANEAEAGINGCIISGEVLEDTQNMHHLPYSNIDFKVGDKYTKSSVTEKKGIRPAFYLNTENSIILSGTGTKEDPYVLDGKPVISVNLNNTELDFYDQPVIKDGIIMLPMDEIYKYLGAKTIDWNNEYKSIAMEYNGNYIYMMLDNKGIIAVSYTHLDVYKRQVL